MLEFLDIFQELANHPEFLSAVPGIIRRDSDTGERVDQFTGEPVDDDPEPEPEPEPQQQTSGGSPNLSFVGNDFLNRDRINNAADELVTVAQEQGTTPSELAGQVEGFIDNDVIDTAERRFEPQQQQTTQTNQGGDTGLGFDADGPLTPDQLDAIRNQDFVDDENQDGRLLDPSEDTGLDTGNDPSLTNERVREIANQEFVPDDTTQRINNMLDQQDGLSLGQFQDEAQQDGSPATNVEAPSVPTDTTFSTDEIASSTTTTDVQNRLTNFVDQLSNLQDRLMEAQQPTEQEESLRERIRERRQDFEAAQESSRQRQAPQFAIRGELSERRQEFNRVQGQLRDDLQSAVSAREQRVSQLQSQMEGTRQNFQLMQNLQEMTRPDVLNTQTTDDGRVITTVQDPMTGQVTTQQAGTIPGQEAELDWRGPVTMSDGTQALYARTEDGIEVRRIPDTVGSVQQIPGVGDGGGGGQPGFTSSDQAEFRGLIDTYGVDESLFSPRVKNTLVNALTPTEAKQFMQDFSNSSSTSPAQFMQDWAQQNTGQTDSGPPEVPDFGSDEGQTATSTQEEDDEGGFWGFLGF